MQKRLGGLLAIALGVVLIGNGLSGAYAGTVGSQVAVPCGTELNAVAGVNTVFNCPQGSITVSSTSPAGVTPPANGWTLKLTSTCLDSTGGQPVNRTLDVLDGTPVVFENLYAYPDTVSPGDAPCLYTLTQTPVAGVTATFDPASPFALQSIDDGDGYAATVNLTHAAVAPTTSAAPSSSASASAAPTEVSRSSSAAPASASSSAAPIAETGPSQPVKASLWLGIGLLLLGFFLLFEGRVRTSARHRR